jgi:hypothetical protein
MKAHTPLAKEQKILSDPPMAPKLSTLIVVERSLGMALVN